MPRKCPCEERSEGMEKSIKGLETSIGGINGFLYSFVTSSAPNHVAGMATAGCSVGGGSLPDSEPQPPKVRTKSKGLGLSPNQKGKGLPSNLTGSLYDLVVPNSDDDEVFIDKAGSTPKPKRSKNIALPTSASEMHWAMGLPKVSNGRSSTKHGEIDPDSQLGSAMPPTQSSSSCPVSPMMPICPKIEHSEKIQLTPMVASVTAANPSVQNELVEYPFAFRPTLEMNLDEVECKIASYVFKHIDPNRNDGMELMFKHGKVFLTRGQMQTLCPHCGPLADVVNTIVMMAYQRAMIVKPARAWYLPSILADDILKLKPMEVIINCYLDRWMRGTSKLEHVFLPFEDVPGVWTLMVVDVKMRVVYSLDVNKSIVPVQERERKMRTILLTLAQIFRLDRNIKSFENVSPDPTTWGPFLYPNGVPQIPNSLESATWCVFWLQRMGQFTISNLGPMINYEEVRMKTATIIVSSGLN
ncbi:hypothetical protein PIB30_092731 [Stylosanthes scabra]|uniref:Uncharacterized protein n=1 Tax=Stylosanthes scabra TaxID=79078 RepID=A0ABU6ZTK1_9FABA|nr:hypothetical protein [Stylosanthes scabra]